MKNVLLAVSLLLTMPVLAQTVNLNIEDITPDSRYTVNNDGTVTDNETGLMWMQCSEGQVWESNGGAGNCTGAAATHTWDAALALANEKSFAGYSDWRLPDIKELLSLVAEDRYDPVINSTVFPATPSSHFWSGSPYAYTNTISWVVDFFSGHDGRHDRNDHFPARLVRSGQ